MYVRSMEWKCMFLCQLLWSDSQAWFDILRNGSQVLWVDKANVHFKKINKYNVKTDIYLYLSVCNIAISTCIITNSCSVSQCVYTYQILILKYKTYLLHNKLEIYLMCLDTLYNIMLL